jgi:NAD-specific glutamate dehydrogenase
MTAISSSTDLLCSAASASTFAPRESDDQVGDRVNDPIQSLGAALRCKVVGRAPNSA